GRRSPATAHRTWVGLADYPRHAAAVAGRDSGERSAAALRGRAPESGRAAAASGTEAEDGAVARRGRIRGRSPLRIAGGHVAVGPRPRHRKPPARANGIERSFSSAACPSVARSPHATAAIRQRNDGTMETSAGLSFGSLRPFFSRGN